WPEKKIYLENLLARITKLSAAISSFNCDKDAARYYDIGSSYANEFGRLLAFANNVGVELSYDAIRLPVVQGDPGQVCRATAAKFSDKEFSDTLKEVSTSLTKATSDLAANNERLAATYTNYLEALRARKTAIQDKLNASQSAIQIGGN